MSHFWVIQVTTKPQVPPGSLGPAGCEGITPSEVGDLGLPRACDRKSLPDAKAHIHRHADTSHMSVSLRWSVSNSLQQELASKAQTFKWKRQRSRMATVRDGFQGSLLAELWFNMKMMILKWQKSSAVINAISHHVPSAQASSANSVSTAKCRSQRIPMLNLPFNRCWQYSFSKTRHLPKCHKV